jgi:ABC-type polysaccharide/polyol phosphate export permease
MRANRHQRARLDLSCALRAWPIVALIGISDVSARYRRSALGQLWITLSLGITVLSIGLVWAYIWKQPIQEFLPYFAVGQVIWVYMTGLISDSTTIYTDHASYLRELNLARSTYLFSNTVKHLVILGHNALILPPIFVIFRIPITLHIFLFVPAFILTGLFLFACSTVLAIVGLRFRDVPSIVASIVGIMYFLTPVLWQLEALPPEFATYMHFNPLAVFLELLRAPILGQVPATNYWWIAIGLTTSVLLLSFRAFVHYRARITFWL